MSPALQVRYLCTLSFRCGHCKHLAPDWAKAATELKGKVKVASVDATVHKQIGGRFQVSFLHFLVIT